MTTRDDTGGVFEVRSQSREAGAGELGRSLRRVRACALVPGNYGPGGMAVAANRSAVWLHIDGAPFVQAADPARMRVTARARTGGIKGLAPAGRRVWVLTAGWKIGRIGPPWSAVSGSVQLPAPPNGPAAALGGDIAAGPGGRLWAGGRALYQVSEASLAVQAFRRFGAVDDVAALGQTLWVQASNGSVYQIVLHRPGKPSAVSDAAMMPLAATGRGRAPGR